MKTESICLDGLGAIIRSSVARDIEERKPVYLAAAIELWSRSRGHGLRWNLSVKQGVKCIVAKLHETVAVKG